LVWTACGNKNATTNPTATTPSVTTAATTTEPATTTTPSTAGSFAEEAATLMCGCPAAKAFAELKKEKEAAGTDKAKIAAFEAKATANKAAVDACMAPLDAKMKALAPADQAQFMPAFLMAIEKQCPDVAATMK
jgi:ABC-type transporter MlaC component